MNRRKKGEIPQSNPSSSAAAAKPIAVIDIGSNSGRVVVLRHSERGNFDTLEDVQAPLRLVEAVESFGYLPPEVIEHTRNVLRDFAAVAKHAGAKQIVAVGTAAVREATNGEAVMAQLAAEMGFKIDIITGKQEAQYAFNGAIHGMALENGMLVDIGGGSMQIVRFRRRKLTKSWTFPLGALRLSTRYLRNDPPSLEERQELTEHIEGLLLEAAIPRLRADEHLVGTGGTIRNLARMDRRTHKYPISRLHGYVLTRARLSHIKLSLEGTTRGERLKTPGLNDERVDSIVGGAFAVQSVMNATHALEMQISGLGLRDGLAIGSITGTPTSIAEVRSSAIVALTNRFSSYNGDAAARRKKIAIELFNALAPLVEPDYAELLSYAATVLDIGKAIDYYNRHDHTADILIATDLPCFSHHDIAMLAALIKSAGSRSASFKGYGPLISPEDEVIVRRLGAILDLSDEIEKRTVPEAPLNIIRFMREANTIIMNVPLLDRHELTLLTIRYRDLLGDVELCVN